tara:strand:+ start:20091 stop:20825 length:735 start_codon:yes stop_codon:yes gene_type:complete
MSASEKRDAAVKVAAEQGSDSGLTDESVREYLKNHDDFLQRYPDMLDYLHVSHVSGSAISLVEKQVSVLRERNTEIRQRLKVLSTNAKDNDTLYEQTRSLVLKLLDANSVEAVYSSFMASMKEDFHVDYASMILYSDSSNDEGWRTEPRESVKKEIGSLFRGHKAVSGTLRTEELNFLFAEGDAVGSAAMMPLSDKGPESVSLGLIAVGSADPNHYGNTVGTLFLSHIADIIVKLLARLNYARD